MGLVYFTNAEMVETTARWAGEERNTFLATPRSRGDVQDQSRAAVGSRCAAGVKS